jgi:imidazolonepropionase-like amidohydrolase
MSRKLIVTAAAVFTIGLAALNGHTQETILIRNGTIVPVVGGTLENGSLLIREGRIVEIGTDITAPADARVIDAKGMYVYPGMVATMTSIGVTGYPGAGNDQNEVGVATPHVDPFDALNPEDNTIEVTRIGGVTTAHTSSGSQNVINGKSIVMNLEGSLASEMTINKYAAQIFNVGAKRENSYPSTLSGTFSMVREKLDKAKDYDEKQRKAERGGGEEDAGDAKGSARDMEMEALVPIVRGEIPAVFLTNDEVTLRNAIRIIKDYGLKGIVQASAGIYRHADQLAAARIPVLWAGTTTTPEPGEPFDYYYRGAALLAEKGITFAFAGGGSHNVRNIPLPAALSVAHGLSEQDAVKALTINPSKILGVDDKVGSLEVGKVANVVIWSGSPIQMKSRVHQLIINGKVIPLTSFQTRLRDKFEKIVKERMKKKS